jgi:hypothetical protein
MIYWLIAQLQDKAGIWHMAYGIAVQVAGREPFRVLRRPLTHGAGGAFGKKLTVGIYCCSPQ